MLRPVIAAVFAHVAAGAVAASAAVSAAPTERLSFASSLGSFSTIAVAGPRGVEPIVFKPSTSPSWSPDGRMLVYVSGTTDRGEVFAVRASGEARNVTRNTADDGDPALSPDGGRIAFSSNRDGDYEIYVIDADGTDLRRVTDNLARDITPTWAPDGTRLAFASSRDGDFEIYTVSAAGGEATKLTDNEVGDDDPMWSPRGNRIAYVSRPEGDWEIVSIAPDGSDRSVHTANEASDIAPAWSPDGRAIAYAGNADGDYEIFVIAEDGSVRQVTSNNSDDGAPAWQPVSDGRPTIRARRGKARPGTVVTLSYVVRDDSPTVTVSGIVLGSGVYRVLPSRTQRPGAGSFRWHVPRNARGRVRFCVTVTDVYFTTSPLSCASVGIG